MTTQPVYRRGAGREVLSFFHRFGVPIALGLLAFDMLTEAVTHLSATAPPEWAQWVARAAVILAAIGRALGLVRHAVAVPEPDPADPVLTTPTGARVFATETVSDAVPARRQRPVGSPRIPAPKSKAPSKSKVPAKTASKRPSARKTATPSDSMRLDLAEIKAQLDRISAGHGAAVLDARPPVIPIEPKSEPSE